ncbi:MAG: microcin ABC transporter ATP-binding protein [Hyphomicrobiales bacterium]|nr:MAG: microcin ABC transporter ATP-binding protein [Hyphomicrobiales bacterium]
MSLLEIKNLCLSFGDIEILRDIDLTIEAGEAVGLVGESGSGKSITSLAAMRLLPPSAKLTGEILFDGRDLLALGENDMCRLRGRDMAMIFQEPMTALNPVKSIGDQIAEGLRFHLGISRRAAEDKVLRLLDEVGLPPARFSPHRYPHELSGGQRQRVVIAIAIAMNPKLLIADEPTTALDVTTQAVILDLLRELAAEHDSALLLITHDLAVVAQMVDRIAVMKDGEIVERGKTLEFFRDMQHPYSKKLLAASKVKPKTVSEIKPSDKPLMAVKDLTRQYRLPRQNLFAPSRYLKAVNDVSFQIEAGESVGLVGESGCGKSTLARTLLALNKPTTGKIEFLGDDLFRLSRHALLEKRRNMQVVFQDPYGSFNPRHKVGRLVAEPLQLVKNISKLGRNERVAEALMHVGLKAEDADKYPHEFSGGQRQRIAIARAIITRPKLIVADEPVSALDVSIREQVLDLLNELSVEQGLAYLFISHDLHVVRAVTDRVLVMYQGQIVEHGATASVFDDPQHEYTKKLLAATPDLQATLQRLEKERV